MQKYFELQFKIITRRLIDLGLAPALTFIGGAIVFIAFSVWLFFKIPLAVYIYPVIALSIVLKLSEHRRNNFLKNLFPLHQFYKLRIIENVLIILPFLLFLIYKNLLLAAPGLLIAAIALVLFDSAKDINLTIPTPFYKKPFEFIVGFRKSVIFILLAYILTIISIVYQNFNLGVFSLLLIFFICFSFYAQPETVFYVWIYHLNARAFILNKIIIALFFSTVLCLPAAILLGVFFSANIYLVIGCQLLGYVFLTTIVLAKYSAYPSNLNLPQGLLLVISLLLPPLLVGVIPFFYLQSLKRLKVILE